MGSEASTQSNSHADDLEHVDQDPHDHASHHPASTPSTDMCIAEAIGGETVLTDDGFAAVHHMIGHASGIKLISSISSVLTTVHTDVVRNVDSNRHQ